MGIVKAATKLTDPNQAVNILEKINYIVYKLF